VENYAYDGVGNEIIDSCAPNASCGDLAHLIVHE
jgi:hypothetical protein